jgi:hypothetical protein
VAATATGGRGRSGDSGGDGSEASASALGVSTGGGAVTVSVEQIAGNGGRARDGTPGAAGDSILVNAAVAQTSGGIELVQRAEGGGGGGEDEGFGSQPAPAQAGGFAQSILDVTHLTGADLTLSSEARGGLAGATSLSNSSLIGATGDAQALGNGAGAVDVSAVAYGGAGSVDFNTDTRDTSGLASARAVGTSTGGPVDAWANAWSNSGETESQGSAESYAEASSPDSSEALAQSLGGAGFADAVARAHGAMLQIESVAHSPVLGFADSLALAEIGDQRPGLIFPNNLEAWARASGLPDEATAAAAIAGNPNVALGVEADEVLALLSLGGGAQSPYPTSAITFEASSELVLDSALLGAGDLRVGLLDPSFRGLGFDVLEFEILVDGALAVSEVFTELAAALVFFDDHLLSLGAPDSGPHTVLFELAVTTDDHDAVFGTSLLLASVPEPTPAWLLAWALLASIWLCDDRLGGAQLALRSATRARKRVRRSSSGARMRSSQPVV